MSDYIIVIESYSPCCKAEAFLEENDRTYYFYLIDASNEEQHSVHSCFVCNHADKAHEIPLEVWQKNLDGPPMLPYDYVNHSEEGVTLSKEDLDIIWTKEGSGAGLLWKGELICFIPEWSNREFPGFSVFLKDQTPFGCDMSQAKEHLEQIIRDSREFWEELEGDYWSNFQQSHLDCIEAYLDNRNQYYAIDGGEFPPKALVTGLKDGNLYGLTLGVSILRQPMVEGFYQEKTADFSRIELGFVCTQEMADYFIPVLQRISSLSGLPWRQMTSFGHGHTILSNAIEGFPAFWLLNANLLPKGCTPNYQPAFRERVNLLWLIPITQREYDFLLEYDMEKIFQITFDQSILIFDGTEKVPIALLKSL